MKESFMNKYKKTLLAGVMLSGAVMFVSTNVFGQMNIGAIGQGIGSTAAGTALSTVSPYAGIAMGAVGLGMSAMNPPPFFVMGVNIDAAQTAAEYMVYQAMKKTTDNWEPEPQKEYQKAAEANGAGCGGGGASSESADGADESVTDSGDLNFDSMVQTLPFQAAALRNVGIEAIGVGPALGEIATAETRSKILEELEWLQEKTDSSAKATQDEDSIPEAGSCEANYSICSKYEEMTPEERDLVAIRQIQNKQNYGTAGIAHADLGFTSVQQAIANTGGNSSAGTAGAAATQTVLAPGKTTTVQNLSGMIGTGSNTVAAMKIVSMMNLELAQRLNQGNMLQGSILTVEAAKAFPDAARLTD